MAVPPAIVWETLADPASYARWVVGSQAVRDADDDWPARGSRFYHRVGIGPLTVNDHTESIDAREPRRLEMRG
jgi:uncharacterized protein YndB with AHSA1/START domain